MTQDKVDDDLLVWEEPPEQIRGQYAERMMRFVERLREHPGESAQFLPPPGQEGWPMSVVTNLNKKFPGIEATSRRTGTKNRHRVWARFYDPERAARADLRVAGSGKHDQKGHR